jgi:taurine--2-oxoglutarate transaminase
MKRLDLVARAREMGDYLGDRLRGLCERHPAIGEVRGLGLFWAVELVRDRLKKTPFNTKADKISGEKLVVDRIAAEMMRNGVAVQAWISHFVIAPPLIITREEIDRGVEVMDRALGIADEEALQMENAADRK